MAKSNRVLIGLVCNGCGRQNYVSQKNRINTSDKVTVKKFCKNCKTRTEHKEKKKLK